MTLDTRYILVVAELMGVWLVRMDSMACAGAKAVAVRILPAGHSYEPQHQNASQEYQ
jgi:hypothetical protein